LSLLDLGTGARLCTRDPASGGTAGLPSDGVPALTGRATRLLLATDGPADLATDGPADLASDGTASATD